MYREIHGLYRFYSRLPDAEAIYISTEPLTEARENVVGQAGWINGYRVIWFRNIPPTYSTFSHELYHIADKKVNLLSSVVDEEASAEIISPLIVYLARYKVKYDAVKLVEEPPSINMILEAVKKVYQVDVKDLIEYYRLRGSIPIYIEFIDGRWRIKKSYSEREIIYYTLLDLVDAALTYPMYRGNMEWRILEELLKQYG